MDNHSDFITPITEIMDNSDAGPYHVTPEPASDLDGSANGSYMTLGEFTRMNVIRFHIPSLICVGFAIIIGVFGNVLVIYAYGFKIKTTRRMFILSLAVLDILNLCLIVAPFKIWQLDITSLHSGDVVCKIFSSVGFGISSPEVLVLTALAVNMYLKICRPHVGRQMTEQKSKYVCLVCVLVGFFVSLPILEFHGDVVEYAREGEHNFTIVHCRTANAYAISTIRKVYNGFVLFITGSLFLTMAVLYTLSCYALVKRFSLRRKGNRKTNPEQLQVGSVGVKQKHHASEDPSSTNILQTPKPISTTRATCMFFCVTLFFLVSYMPYLILKLIHVNEEELGVIEGNMYYVGVNSYFLNNMCNPLLYRKFDLLFQRECQHIWKNMKCHLFGNDNV